MESLNELLRRAAARPDTLTAADIAELQRAVRDYPASTLADVLLLKYGADSLSEAERDTLRRRIALRSGLAAESVVFVDPSGHDFASFYPPAPTDVRPTTESAIDTFLQTYGHQSPEEDALLERMIFNPVPDYAEQLAREAADKPAKTDDGDWQSTLIDRFLGSEAAADAPLEPEPAPPVEPTVAKPKAPKPKAKEETPQSGLFSESLAKIFIKQGRYERAYEIITNLNLNYPEKSVYFADQLRFLEKLIINQRLAKAPEK